MLLFDAIIRVDPNHLRRKGYPVVTEVQNRLSVDLPSGIWVDVGAELPLGYKIDPVDYMAMWEAMLEAPKPNHNITDAIGGAQGMRRECIAITKAAIVFYDALPIEEQEQLSPFDWEFCPRYLTLVQWEQTGAITPTDKAARAALIKT